VQAVWWALRAHVGGLRAGRSVPEGPRRAGVCKQWVL
jgi:hypothetical protein